MKLASGERMANTYRKASGCQTWHFCSNCSHWPKEDYEEQGVVPGTGQLCNECKVLRDVDLNCR
jgi:hypothetical protein